MSGLANQMIRAGRSGACLRVERHGSFETEVECIVVNNDVEYFNGSCKILGDSRADTSTINISSTPLLRIIK